MNPELPDKIFGIETEGALERYLEQSKEPKEKETPSQKVTPAPPSTPKTVTPVSTSVPNLNDYIVLEGGQHGSYSYPDLLVSTERSHYGGNWNQAHDALHQEDAYMLTIRQFVDFLQLLKSGNPVYNGNGNQIGSKEVEKVLDDIIAVRDPLRAEWLDAQFSERSGTFYIAYHKINNNGTLEQVTEPLEECLMREKPSYIRADIIDLDYWINNATSQGLPSKNTPAINFSDYDNWLKSNGLHYFGPRNGDVADFDADSACTYLLRSSSPKGWSHEKGVRAAREKK